MSPVDEKGFRKFLVDAEKRYKVAFENTNTMGREPMNKLWATLKMLPIFALLRADRSVFRHVAKRVSDPRLRFALSFHPLFVGANNYTGKRDISFSIVRYGNVMGSRGSVIPLFIEQIKTGKPITMTDPKMTRFMITLEEGVELVWHALQDMIGGEIYVKKIPSMKVTDIAKVIAPKAKHEIIGIRPGEKIHEQMISLEDSYSTFEYKDYYKILPQINSWSEDKRRIKKGKKVKDGFIYTSDNNSNWMTKNELKNWINVNRDFIGKF